MTLKVAPQALQADGTSFQVKLDRALVSNLARNARAMPSGRLILISWRAVS
jgi:hypothetical protein